MKYKMISQDNKDSSFYLREGISIAGRGSDADVMLHRPSVSRIHAALYKKDEGCFVTDLRSVNGTYLNGQILPPERSVALQEGDRIAFGDEKYLFCREEDEPERR